MNEQPLEVIPEQAEMPLAKQDPRQPGNVTQPITPAQAKVEAIATLTMSAYQKAATLGLTPEETKALQADFPDEAFKPGAGGKEALIYIEHAFLRDRFTQVFGMGQWAIVPRARWGESFTTSKGTPGERIYVEAMLIVRGCWVGEAVGAMEYYPRNESQNYGDAVEGAKTAAFRRCAKEFGVGLQAWKKDWCDGWWQRRRANPAPRRPATPKSPAPTPPLTPAGLKARFLERMKSFGSVTTDYFREIGVLMPNEDMADFPEDKVPTTKEGFDKIWASIESFYKTFKGNDPLNPPKPPAKPIEVPRDTAPASGEDDPPCFAVIVPIPPKGQRKQDYIHNPDTIGSLYHAMKAGDEAAQSRLWGFAKHFEPKPWKKMDGTIVPPSDTDKAFRAALDEFLEWHDSNPNQNDDITP